MSIPTAAELHWPVSWSPRPQPVYGQIEQSIGQRPFRKGQSADFRRHSRDLRLVPTQPATEPNRQAHVGDGGSEVKRLHFGGGDPRLAGNP